VSYWPRDARSASLLRPVVPSRRNALSFDVLLSLQTLRIAIHRRKGTTLKLLFIVVPFFGGCFDAFHAAALKAGGTENGAPGLRRPNYYAAFVLDPDGNNPGMRNHRCILPPLTNSSLAHLEKI
jgi:hypothetical protein